MTQRESGQVTAVSDKGTTYGIALGMNNWFNGKGKPTCAKGDQVDVVFEFEQHPKFGQVKAIQQVYVVGSAPVPAAKPGVNPGKPQSNEIQQMSKLKNKTNARICALTCAKDMSEKGTQPELIIAMAKTYLDWIYQEE